MRLRPVSFIYSVLIIYRNPGFVHVLRDKDVTVKKKSRSKMNLFRGTFSFTNSLYISRI